MMFGQMLLFQFYDSPIKSTLPENTSELSIESFNSMIVRLKGALGVKSNSPDDFVSIL